MRTVIHFTDSTAFGGSEKMLLTVLENLDRRTWKPLLMHHPGPGIEELLDGARHLGVDARPVPRVSPGAGARGRKALGAEIGADRPAVFHAHLSWTLRCSEALRAARSARVPAVVATQQLFSEIQHPLEMLRQRLVASSVDRYIAVSVDLARRLGATPLFPRRKIRVIRNAVRTEDFEAASPSVPPREGAAPVVVTLARLDPQKDLRTLLRAAVQVPDARFLIAGEGPERPALEAELDRLGLRGRVELLGHRSDVAALLARADLFVLPSLHEGLPVSVLEAMAAGKPVVATAIGGTDEAVSDGETGLLVRPGDPGRLAAAIRVVLSDPALADRLGRAGRRRVRAEFSARKMGDEVAQLYESLLPEMRAGAGAR